MATSAMWWLVTSLTLSARDIAFSERVTWPNCSMAHRIIEPGQIDNNVTELTLSGCEITSINPDKLKCYPNLEELNISFNQISHFEAGIFDSNTALKRLYFTYNAFLGKNLPPNLFRNNHNLWGISFSGNNMSDTPAELLQGLDKLYALLMTNCSLNEIPLFVLRPEFPDMRSLNFQHNQIPKLDNPDTFTNVPHLDSANLANNQIDYLHADLLKPLNAISKIDMGSNKIRYIPEGFFQNKSSLTDIDLSYNQIEYVYASAFQGTNLKKLMLNENRLTYMPDRFFTELQSIGVSLTEVSFFGNPWQCACLNELLVQIKKLKIVYEGSKSDGRHPVCIITGTFKCHRISIYHQLYDILIGRMNNNS